MAKTVVVEIEWQRSHPKYGKRETRVTKVYAHTEKEIAVGTTVVLEESKPISKLKRWVVVEVKSESEKE